MGFQRVEHKVYEMCAALIIALHEFQLTHCAAVNVNSVPPLVMGRRKFDGES
jgi:hypothetical protein